MRIFYVPDGHRRYAVRNGCSLEPVYELGYRVLLDEIIRPLFRDRVARRLDVFLLSNLNLARRDPQELDLLLQLGEVLVPRLIAECRSFCSIRTWGTYLPKNIHLASGTSRDLNLIIGTRTADELECGEVDLFIRSGGELRLSGAPRSLVGDYTQFVALPKLHPELQYADVLECVTAYQNRYMREAAPTPSLPQLEGAQ